MKKHEALQFQLHGIDSFFYERDENHVWWFGDGEIRRQAECLPSIILDCDSVQDLYDKEDAHGRRVIQELLRSKIKTK